MGRRRENLHRHENR